MVQFIQLLIYTKMQTIHSDLFLSSSLYKSGITTIQSEQDRETVLDSLVQDFGYGSLHHLDDSAHNLEPAITAEEAELIDRLINECHPVATDEERTTGTTEFDIYGYVLDLVKLYGLDNQPIEVSPSTVCSSHGILMVHPFTGEVISRQIAEPDSEEGQDLASITRFDLTEWAKHYGEAQLPNQIDILDLGYWYTKDNTTQYEEPAHDWRIETAEIRKENSGETYMLINH